jgi:hypothetical protein
VIEYDRQLEGEERELAIVALQSGMTLGQFWDATPKEIELYVEAHKRERDMEMDMLAWVAANVMAPHLKRPVSPRKLLGKSSSVLGMKPEEIRAAVERRKGNK